MSSVNKVILIGNCGRDPEIRYAPSGEAIANISIATSSRRTDKNTGEKIETTEWHRVTFFGKLAEIVGEYVVKGKPLYVEGRLKYGKFTNKDGVEQNSCDIIATEMQLLGGNPQGGSRDNQQGGQQAGQAPQGNQGQQRPPQRQAPQGNQGNGNQNQQRQAPQRQAPQGNGYAPQASNRHPPQGQPQRQNASGFDDTDDDIPF